MKKIVWPEGRKFAFSVFDDTDLSTMRNVPPVYALLADLGFRTTKSCWPVDGDPSKGSFSGKTCDDPDYREWVLGLQSQGFEIGWHNSTWHGLPREGTIAALEKFGEIFGHYPLTATHHSEGEGVYWGSSRVSGINVFLYNMLTRFREQGRHRGHIPGDEYFFYQLKLKESLPVRHILC